MCTFVFWVEHCSIWNRCILEFMILVDWNTDDRKIYWLYILARLWGLSMSTIMCGLDWLSVHALARWLFCPSFSEMRSNEGINTKITLEWVHKQFVTRGHAWFNFFHDMLIPYMIMTSHYLNQWWHILIGPWGTNFSKILIELYTFSFKIMHLKVSSGKWRPSCLDLNVLSTVRSMI